MSDADGGTAVGRPEADGDLARTGRGGERLPGALTPADGPGSALPSERHLPSSAARAMSRWPERLIGEPKQRVKVRIGQLLSKPVLGTLVSSASGNRIRNRGVVIDTSPPAFTSIVKAQLAFGIYESAEIRFIRKYLRGRSRVLELGASLGVTAAHILDVAAPGAEVVCVEANPYLMAALRTTTAIAAQRVGATARTIHGAVPPNPNVGSGAVVLTLGGSHLDSRVGLAGVGDPGRQLRIPAVDLAEVVRNWTDYALVCDIEGAEAALILSAQPVLTGASRLVIELHDTAYGGAAVTVADLRKALLSMGFLLVAEKGRVLVLDGPEPG
jgi:FkbM family methyltransferase